MDNILQYWKIHCFLSSLFILQLKKSKQHKDVFRTIIRILDDLWNEIKNILPDEKPDNSIGRPIVPYRKVLDARVFVLRTIFQWKMLPKEYSSGSTCHKRFQEWRESGIFDKLGGTRPAKITNILKR